MEYTFKLSNYDSNCLNEQLSQALEKHTELLSRHKLSRIWKRIDQLNSLKTTESVRKHRAVRYKIYGIVLLLLGIFLLIPGLMEPTELIVPLLTGVFCIGLGIIYLLPRKKINSKRFSKAASELLNKLQRINQSEEQHILVRFTPEGMALMNEDVISYHCFNRLIQTKDMYVLIWNKRITVLQKKDLISSTQQDFVVFLKEYTGLEPICLL